MNKRNNNFSANEKISILRRHLVDKESVSDLCKEYDLQPSILEDWLKQLLEKGDRVFEEFSLSAESLKKKKDDENRDRLIIIGQVAGGIAHELKNPLFAISSGIQLLHGELTLEEDQGSTFEIIFQETMRMDRMIKQLLTFSAIKQLKRVPTKFSLLINEVISLTKGLLQEKKIKVASELNDEMPAILLDRDMFMQVLINLFQNAIEASKENDTISISCDIDSGNNCAVVKVLDEGPGVPEKDKEKIFDPYFSTKKGNSGMGLAITKKIIVDHGGEIWIERKEGRGAVFVIEVPLTPDEK